MHPVWHLGEVEVNVDGVAQDWSQITVEWGHCHLYYDDKDISLWNEYDNFNDYAQKQSYDWTY